MKKSIIVVLAAIVVLLFSGLAICSALVPSNESLSSNGSQPSNIISTSSPVTALYSSTPPPPPPDGELIPPEPYPTYSPEPYPTGTPTPKLSPTSPPLEGQPSTPPQPSTGKTAIGEDVSTLPAPSGMTSITEEKVTTIGGAPAKLMMISGSQLWVLYNGAWTMNPAAIYYGDWTCMLFYNDQGQWISTKETYPSGWIDPRNWGYLYPGYYSYWFKGDAVGWHKIVAVGSATGQSNVIWIYVWPKPWPTPTPTPTWPPWPTPTPTPTWPPWPPTPTPTTFTVSAAWPSSYTYYIGSPTCIYFTVNKPCYARVTYLKQNSNIVWSGPTYFSAGTHTDTGTIGWPKGMRTVVVDAWTISGEYDSAVTSYNVV